MDKKRMTKNISFKKLWVIYIILVLAIGISGCSADDSQDETELDNTVQTETDNNKSEELKEETENDEEENWGSTDIYYKGLSQEEKNVYDKVAKLAGREKILEVKILDESETDKFFMIVLQFPSDDESDKNAIKSYMLDINKEILKELSEMPEVKELNSVEISNLIPLLYKDIADEELNQNVITMRPKTETMVNTNWEDILPEDLEEVFDHYRENPNFTGYTGPYSD